MNLCSINLILRGLRAISIGQKWKFGHEVNYTLSTRQVETRIHLSECDIF